MRQKKLPKLITLRWLRAQGACYEGLQLFKQHFPGGMVLTKGNLYETVNWPANLFWFAWDWLSDNRMLNDADREGYRQLRAAVELGDITLTHRYRGICDIVYKAAQRAYRKQAKQKKVTA